MAQADKKQVNAHRIANLIKIDGTLNETEWQQASEATDFIVRSPKPGTQPAQRSVVKVLFDNEAVYIGAWLYDTAPDSVLTMLSKRDDVGNSDWFGVTIDAFQDNINGFGFIVTAAGVQFDTKYAATGEDNSWDAVWESAVKVDKNGWTAEFRLPFSALRFPKKNQQTWNINFTRNIRRLREQSWWSELNPEINGFFNQAGWLTGIEHIKTPLRLSLTPYVALTYFNNEADNSQKTNINGGMDLKYGINDAFTLDMTLVPDFGQVRSDNQVLNLSPFEVRFNENRPFFTEGTELFNKAGLFYSRRVGSTPLRYHEVADELQSNEDIIENPKEVKLLNASKISGRTTKNLGIGVFNAVTQATEAVIINNDTQKKRSIATNPLANYNVLVFDQAFKHNSYLSFINTNVWRSGSHFYDANVSGTEFQFQNKKGNLQIRGSGALSQKYFNDATELGHTYFTHIAKIGGKWNYGIAYNEESNSYDPNDLGFLYNNNERTVSLNLKQNLYKAFWHFNEMYNNLNISYSRLYAPNRFQNFGINFESNWFWKNFFANGTWIGAEPFVTYDFFEPRLEGRFYTYPKNFTIGNWFSSDYRKRFAFDAWWEYRHFYETDSHRRNIHWNIAPRFRVNDKLSLVYTLQNNNYLQDKGFADHISDDADNTQVIIAERDVVTYEQSITAAYLFTNRMGLDFRLRHYWSDAEYRRFFLLGENDGLLYPTTYADFDNKGYSLHNVNFNAFNIDLVYTWRFAPGSDINITWKNAILTSKSGELYNDLNFSKNMETLFREPQANSLSLKIIYYVDYQQLQQITRTPRKRV